MRWLIRIMLLSSVALQIHSKEKAFLELDQYYRMPKLFAYDDYDECLEAYDTPEPVYCVTRSVIKPDNSSSLWRLIRDFSADTYRHFRHDHLDRGLCVERCRRLLSELTNETIQQLYVEKFDIDFPYIISDKPFENVQHDRTHFGKLINVCENYRLKKQYNLTAFTEIEYCVRPTHQIKVDLLDMSFIAVTMLLILLVVGSSWFDSRINQSGKIDHFKMDIRSQKSMLLTSFSVKRNWYRLIGRSKDQLNEDLKFFQAFRFLTFSLVIMGHCADMFSVTPIANPIDREKEYYTPEGLALINGSQVVQTFFEMSGFLLSIHFFTSRESMKKMSWWTVVAVVVYRFIRLTPAYAYVILLHATWLPKMQNGPMWPRGTSTERYFCRKNWWTNILYVNNYVNADEPCLQQAWYLACDYQLFTLGMILVVAVTKYPKLRNTLYSLALILAYIIPGFIIYFGAFDGAFINRLQDERFIYWYDRMYHQIYIPFHTNMGCYLGGILLGAIYFHQRQKFHDGNRAWYLKAIFYCTVPLGAMVMYANSIFYENDFPKPSIWMAIFYPTLKHSWIFLGAILIYGVIYEYSGVLKRFLNFSIFVPLGRLTYCAYVCHVFMLKNVFFGNREVAYFSKMNHLSKALTVLIASYVIGLMLALLLEFPATALQKQLFSKKLEQAMKPPPVPTEPEINNIVRANDSVAA
ncbi:nose resistant to fluoxetine protein 6-like [Uranotaenia lowii]|uniref:nose resistant to fluoxetine protein 6-like n=1 Tax=Uranotaenia lowii TaxID=190385 RepID=UPI00247A68FB|nr:nose resistant to fluoxetine protein 6-like [Uranotaenia lowii]